jgi:copper transport protein
MTAGTGSRSIRRLLQSRHDRPFPPFCVGWLAGLALVAVVGSADVAVAHSLPVSSIPGPGANLPAAPGQVTITFNEPPDPGLSAIAVIDAHGQSVARGTAAVVPGAPDTLRVALTALGQGLYTVRWRAVSSVDGHAAAGSFVFGVATAVPAAASASAPSAPDLSSVSLAALIGRWLLYAGLFVLLGAAFVGNLIYRSPPAVTLPLCALAWLAAAMGLALVIGIQAADAGVGPGQMLGTSIGRAAILRAVPILLAGIAVLVQWSQGRQTVRALGVVGIAAATALLADAETSHAAGSAASHVAGHGSHVDVFIQWLHVTAAGTWLGGLVALLVSLRGLPSAETGNIARRFAISAMIGIAVVASTGLLRAISEIGSVTNLATTDFGHLLVAKSALLLLLAVLGAINHFRNVPVADQFLRPLRRIGSMELIVAATVLLLSASLVNAAPPGQASAPSAAQSAYGLQPSVGAVAR